MTTATHRAFELLRHRRVLSVAGAIVLLTLSSGCAAPASDRTAAKATTGAAADDTFLVDTSGFKDSPDHPGRRFELSKRLKDYRAFIIEKPRVVPNRSVRGVTLTDEEKTSLAASYVAEMREAIAAQRTVTETPGPGVARIRSSITAVARSRDDQSGDRQDGGASHEMEVVDSITGTRLAAVIETDMGQDNHTTNIDRPFHDAKVTFTHWAARFMLMLNNVDQLATRP